MKQVAIKVAWDRSFEEILNTVILKGLTKEQKQKILALAKTKKLKQLPNFKIESKIESKPEIQNNESKPEPKQIENEDSVEKNNPPSINKYKSETDYNDKKENPPSISQQPKLPSIDELLKMLEQIKNDSGKPDNNKPEKEGVIPQGASIIKTSILDCNE
jgi:hypothetical protein